MYINQNLVYDSYQASKGTWSDGTSTTMKSELTTIEGLTSNLDFSTLWGDSYVLRLGSDGFESKGSPEFRQSDHHGWAGRVHMLALYPKQLSQGEVVANFDAGLANSVPTAQDYRWSVPEDSCTRLPDLTLHASDWDSDAPSSWDGIVQRSQPLDVLIASPSLSGSGALYTDSACTVAGTPADYPDVYFQPAADAFTQDPTNGAAYASLVWRASDGIGESADATLEIVVSAVNDKPVPSSSAHEAYMGVRLWITLAGSDVDSPMSQASELSPT